MARGQTEQEQEKQEAGASQAQKGAENSPYSQRQKITAKNCRQ